MIDTRLKTDRMSDTLISAAEREAKQPPTIRIDRWPLLSRTRFLRRGGLSILAGSPGCAKSFLCLEIGFRLYERRDTEWLYLPLESLREDHCRRAAAVITNSWRSLSEDGSAVDVLLTRKGDVNRCSHRILANPSLEGDHDPTPESIVRAANDAFASGTDVFMVDPLAAIGSGAFKFGFEAEAHIAKELARAAARHGKVVLMVVHTRKILDGRIPTLGDLQGSADISRLADSVLFLQTIEPKQIDVYAPGGIPTQAESNRLIHVLKSRHGIGGLPLAYRFGEHGPRFDELGSIRSRRGLD